MKATDFEFRWRGLVLGAIFWVSFALYAVDRMNVVQAVLGPLAYIAGLSQVTVAHVIFALAALLAAVAALLRTWASAMLRKEVVHDARLHTEALVADGPYRYTRNPLYLGTNLLTVAFALLASRLGAVVMLVAIVLFNYRLIWREEAELEAQHGDSFRRYCARVPRLLPSLSPRVEAGGRKPDWVSGFASESYFWAFAVAQAAFAVTLSMKVFVVGVVVAIVLLVVLGNYATRRGRASGAEK